MNNRFYEWFKKYLTKDILSEMGTNRDKAEDRVSGLAGDIYLHVFKVQAYHHQRSEDVSKWICEIWDWMNQIHDIQLKPNNKRIPLKSIKLWMETGFCKIHDLYSYERRVKIFVNRLKLQKPPYPDPDKDFIVNQESADQYINVMNKLMWFMSAENKLDDVDHDEIYNCIYGGFKI